MRRSRKKVLIEVVALQLIMSHEIICLYLSSYIVICDMGSFMFLPITIIVYLFIRYDTLSRYMFHHCVNDMSTLA